jgi:hypothetical protein
VACNATRVRAFLQAAAGVVLVTCTLRAQTVRGHLEADVTKERLSGGVVVAVDAAGHDAAPSAITNANGEFALRFLSPGRYTVSVRRLGYRPVQLSVGASASDTTITVRMSPVPTRLLAVATKSRGQCRLQPGSDSTIWSMWSAAELAMLNARVASGTGEYQFGAEFFTRTYDIASAKLTEVSLQDTAIVGGRPWASLPADSLAHNGFVSATENHMTFVGPDLDALLSQSFLDNHCFSVHPQAPEDSGLVGLDFAPEPRPRHIDIRGTFWLDPGTSELRALTYYYDELPYSRSDAGGRIEFVHVSTGAWVMTHWSIRAPLPLHGYLLTVASRAALDAFHAERVVNHTDPSFVALTAQVTGGNVRTVRYAGASSSVLWTAPVSTLTVHVRERSADSTYATAEGDIVRVRGSTRQAVTDKNGDAVFPDMLSGEYIVEAAAPVQDVMELPPDRRVVVVKAPAPVSADARVMSEAVAIRAACGVGLDRNEGVLSGRLVRDELAADDERISVVSLFGTYPYRLDGIKADADGRFRACGVPKGVTLIASVVAHHRQRATARVTIPATERFGSVSLDFKQTAPWP